MYFLKFNKCTLIINYISKSCFSLIKKDCKIEKFCLRCTLAIFSKNARILTVIFIGYRQLDNNLLPATAYTATPFLYTTTT
jgi:hypothetical protein